MAGTNNLAKHVMHEGRHVQEHVLLVEKVLGRRLPQGACVHHVDCDPTNNSKNNLLVCPDHAYHMIIHQRTRAYDACGHAHWVRCHLCKKYGPAETMRYNAQHRLRWHNPGLGCKRAA